MLPPSNVEETRTKQKKAYQNILKRFTSIAKKQNTILKQNQSNALDALTSPLIISEIIHNAEII